MEPFLGQVSLFPYGFVPRGWLPCNGQLLAINQNLALNSLIGTTYGGNGQTNFALPNLNGRVVIHPDASRNITLGQAGGEEQHTLTINEMPAHNHLVKAGGAAASTQPKGLAWGTVDYSIYSTNISTSDTMNSNSIVNSGGSQPHNNMQPYSVATYCIATAGIFPSRN